MDAQAKRQAMEIEAEKYKLENDPVNQFQKLGPMIQLYAPEKLGAYQEQLADMIAKKEAKSNVITPSASAVPTQSAIQQIGQPSVPSITGGISSPKSIGMTGFTVGAKGNPTIRFGQTPQTEAEKKAQAGVDSAQQQVTGTGRLLQRFNESYSELKKYDPEIGISGTSGWVSRKGASVANYFDELPVTKAFHTQLPVLANAQARQVEGGKITDKDRETYANAMVSALKHPSVTNVILAGDALVDLADKGGDLTKVISELAQDDNEISQGILKRVYKVYPKYKNSEAVLFAGV